MPSRPLQRFGPTPAVFRWMTATVIAATVVVIVSGALVRLTGSGLGCSDWPACERDQFVAALDKPHAVMEFVNRMLSGILGVPIVLVLVAAIVRRPFRVDLLGWSLGLFGGVMTEAVLGAIVVKAGLTPPMVIAHFVVAIAMLWNALVLHHRAGEPEPLTHGRREAVVADRLQTLGWLAAIVAAITIVMGTVVTGAGPHGGDTRAVRLPFAISAVARIHGVAAWVCLALIIALLFTLLRSGAPAPVRRRATWVTGAVLGQGVVGYVQYALGLPQVLVGIHVLGSTVVWITVVRLVLSFTAWPASAAGSAAAPPLAPPDDVPGRQLASV